MDHTRILGTLTARLLELGVDPTHAREAAKEALLVTSTWPREAPDLTAILARHAAVVTPADPQAHADLGTLLEFVERLTGELASLRAPMGEERAREVAFGTVRGAADRLARALGVEAYTGSIEGPGAAEVVSAHRALCMALYGELHPPAKGAARGEAGAAERDGATVHAPHPAMVMAAQAIEAAGPTPERLTREAETAEKLMAIGHDLGSAWDMVTHPRHSISLGLGEQTMAILRAYVADQDAGGAK